MDSQEVQVQNQCPSDLPAVLPGIQCDSICRTREKKGRDASRKSIEWERMLAVLRFRLADM
jgi:hypothetical protein